MCHIFHDAVFLALIAVVIPKARGDDRCSFQNLVDCSKPLSVLTDSGMAVFNSKSDLEKICPNLKDAIKCIHGFTRHCMNKEDRLHFRKLFYGTGSMIHDLCRPGKYQDEYLKHANCMIKASMENEICFDTYTTAMEQLRSNSVDFDQFQPAETSNFVRRKRGVSHEGIKNVCCAFQQYVECSTSMVDKKCGKDTAHFSLHFLKKTSSTMLNVHCTEYEKIGCGLIKLQSTATRTLFRKSIFFILMAIIQLIYQEI